MIFFKIIAWVLAILSTIWWGLQLFWAITYPGSTEETLDNFRGFTRTFKPMRYFVIALVCWAFIIAF